MEVVVCRFWRFHNTLMGWQSITDVSIPWEATVEGTSHSSSERPENLLKYVTCWLTFLLLCGTVLHELACQSVNPFEVFFHVCTVIYLTSMRWCNTLDSSWARVQQSENPNQWQGRAIHENILINLPKCFQPKLVWNLNSLTTNTR